MTLYYGICKALPTLSISLNILAAVLTMPACSGGPSGTPDSSVTDAHDHPSSDAAIDAPLISDSSVEAVHEDTGTGDASLGDTGPGDGGPIADLQPGHWFEVPSSKMEDVFPSPTPAGNSGSRSVMDAWNGAAFDSTRDRLVVWGGGHLDYSGNEVYAFDIATLSWQRLIDPTSPTETCVDYYYDGRPSPPHTYNMLEYMKSIDRFISAKGGGYGADCMERPNDNLFNLLDLGTLTWERGPRIPENGKYIGRNAVYDSSNGHLWVVGTYGASRLAEYDPVANAWVSHGSPGYLEIYGTAAIDPTRHLMVLVGGYGGNRQARVWDLEHPEASPFTPSTSGEVSIEAAKAPGFEYDPTIGRFVAWNGGSDIYTLDPDTWSWEKIEAATTNVVVPTAPNERGTYGRFRYIPSRNAFVLVNRTDENVFLYRL